uniref:RNA binding motif protein X-linked 2 n=1 Tax=Rousettus aegyptiacus TaxID=9407 RepID=A0A7J8ELH6_ROUAE|nr:RNA binding motif protein X-linked 2 [Rousettus aegyptiacus]
MGRLLTLIWCGTRRLENLKDSVFSAMKTRGAQFWLLTILMGSRSKEELSEWIMYQIIGLLRIQKKWMI